MENLVKIGMVKSIGMSNFNHEQMERVIKEGTIKPAVLQVERNPRFTQVKITSAKFLAFFVHILVSKIFSQNFYNGVVKMTF